MDVVVQSNGGDPSPPALDEHAVPSRRPLKGTVAGMTVSIGKPAGHGNLDAPGAPVPKRRPQPCRIDLPPPAKMLNIRLKFRRLP
jgi:hypothetical protein